MKNSLYNIALAFILTFSLTSCDLDRFPDSGIPEHEAMQTPDDAQQVIFGIYSGLKSSGLYSGTLTLAPDLQCDLAQAVQGYSNAYGELYRWITKSTDQNVESVYASLYAIINRCNYFLERVVPLEGHYTSFDDRTVLNKCKADAFFIRALAYSDLIRLFAKAYDPATAKDELGVSIVTHYSETGEKPLRSSLSESYAQVLSDLHQSDSLMKRRGYSAPFITTGAVHALQARVYLHMQNWEAAVDAATKVIESGDYRLQSAFRPAPSGLSEFAHMWRFDEGTEVILRVAMSYTDRGGALGIPFLGSPQQINMNQYLPDFVPAQWVLDLYGNKDYRKVIYFQNQTTAYPHNLTWPLLNKYPGNANIDAEAGGRRVLTNEPKILRLAEVYLVRAEAYYRLGMEKEANDDLTTLRKTRIEGYGTTAASGENLFKEIRDERVRELCMEGFRLSDLKRWGLGFQRVPQKSTVDGPNRFKADSSNPLFTWPIPKHEIDAVPGMQPNESND